jgi:Tol biopolymer transport system component
LAYVSRRGEAGLGLGLNSIVVRSLETGEERELVPRIGISGQPHRRIISWSRDGKALVVHGRNEKGRTGLYRVDARTAEAKPLFLFEPQKGANHFYLLPDEKSFLILRAMGQPLTYSVVQIDIATRKERVVHASAHVHSLDVSPDGRFLAVGTSAEEDARAAGSREPNAIRLLVVPIAGGEPRELLRVHKDQEVSSVVWTPDQKYLLLNIQVGPPEAASPESRQVWRIPAEGGKPEATNLTMGSRQVQRIRFRPDGRKLAFTVVDEQSNEIWMIEDFLPAQKAAK